MYRAGKNGLWESGSENHCWSGRECTTKGEESVRPKVVRCHFKYQIIGSLRRNLLLNHFSFNHRVLIKIAWLIFSELIIEAWDAFRSDSTLESNRNGAMRYWMLAAELALAQICTVSNGNTGSAISTNLNHPQVSFRQSKCQEAA